MTTYLARLMAELLLSISFVVSSPADWVEDAYETIRQNRDERINGFVRRQRAM